MTHNQEKNDDLTSISIHKINNQDSTINDKKGYKNLSSKKVTKEKRKKLIIGFILVITSFFIGIVIYGFIYFRHLVNEEALQELKSYEAIQNDIYNTYLYEEFIRNFPRSSHYGEIKVRLSRLKNMKSAWKQIANSSNINSFVDFKNTFRDPRYAQLCNHKIDSLDWENAKKQNTPNSYQRYIINHTEGQYINEAEKQSKILAFMNISQQQEDKIRNITDLFINAINENNDTLVYSLTTHHLKQFIDLKDIQTPDLLIWICEKYRNNSFINYTLQDKFNIRKEITEDNEEIFVNECRIEEMKTNEFGEAQTTLYDVVLKYNRNYQIISLEVKNINH